MVDAVTRPRGPQKPALDAQRASEIVRDYFLDIHGPYLVWGFLIEHAQKAGKGWIVRCSFASSPQPKEPRHTYEVEIAADESVGKVQLLNGSRVRKTGGRLSGGSKPGGRLSDT